MVVKYGGEVWKWNRVGMGNLLQLSVGDMCVTKNGATQNARSTVLGTMKFEAGRHYFFKLELRGLPGTATVCFGVTNQSAIDQDANDPYKLMSGWTTTGYVLPAVTRGGFTIYESGEAFLLVDGKKQRLVAMVNNQIYQMPIKFPCWPCLNLFLPGNSCTIFFDISADIRSRLKSAP